MARRYLVDPLPEPGPARLPTDVGRHLGRVLRARPGDVVVLFDGRGREARAIVRAVQGEQVDAEVSASQPREREPHLRLEVAFAAPRGARGDWLHEHGCEIGVASFQPIVTARARRAARDDRAARWRRIVRAACEQCDRSRVPAVHDPVPLGAFLDRGDLPAERYVADPAGPPLGAARTGCAVLVVGPEGGFDPDEQAALLAAGFEPRGLGPLTLRTETAVLAGAARLLSGR